VAYQWPLSHAPVSFYAVDADLLVPFLHLSMLAFVPSDQVDLIDLDRARQFRGGGCGHHPLPKLTGQLLGINEDDAQLVCDLAITQIQPHRAQSRDAHPQRLMVARKHSVREIVELLLTPQTAVSLSGSLMLVPALFGDLVCVAVGTSHSPASDGLG
jgi:hypothetical protein